MNGIVGVPATLGEPCERQRNVTMCARVQMTSGENVVSVVPSVTPCSSAHSTLSENHSFAGTSWNTPMRPCSLPSSSC